MRLSPGFTGTRVESILECVFSSMAPVDSNIYILNVGKLGVKIGRREDIFGRHTFNSTGKKHLSNSAINRGDRFLFLGLLVV